MDIKFDKEKAIRLYNTISEHRGYGSITDATKDEIDFLKRYFILSNKVKNIPYSTGKEIERNEILKEHLKLIIDYGSNFRNIKIKFILNYCKESYSLEEKVFIELCDEIYKNRFKYY